MICFGLYSRKKTEDVLFRIIAKDEIAFLEGNAHSQVPSCFCRINFPVDATFTTYIAHPAVSDLSGVKKESHCLCLAEMIISRCQAKFLTSRHVRMHRVIFYILNTSGVTDRGRGTRRSPWQAFV